MRPSDLSIGLYQKHRNVISFSWSVNGCRFCEPIVSRPQSKSSQRGENQEEKMETIRNVQMYGWLAERMEKQLCGSPCAGGHTGAGRRPESLRTVSLSPLTYTLVEEVFRYCSEASSWSNAAATHAKRRSLAEAWKVFESRAAANPVSVFFMPLGVFLSTGVFLICAYEWERWKLKYCEKDFTARCKSSLCE